MDQLTYKTVGTEVSIEISKDKKKVAIFYQIRDKLDPNKIADFNIEYLWDMLKDTLATMKVGPDNPTLFRRMKEAKAAVKYIKSFDFYSK